MVAQPEQHVQDIIALTGKANFEEVGQLDAEGRPTEKATPWCRQMARDLEELEVLEVVEPMVMALGGRILPIFREDGWKQDCLAIYLREMRAQLWQSKVPPPGSVARKDWERMEVAETQPEDEKKKCPMCARFFKDCQSLMQHLRKEHGMGNLLRILTPTNQCMWCASTFANRMSAQQHVISAYECGRCIADMSIAKHPVVEPVLLTCRVCGFTAESWLQLRVLKFKNKNNKEFN